MLTRYLQQWQSEADVKIMGLIFLIAMAVAFAQTRLAGPQTAWEGVPIQNGIGTQIVGNGINVVRIPRTLIGNDFVVPNDCHGLIVAHPPVSGWIFALNNPATLTTTFPQACEPIIHNYGPGTLSINGAFGDGNTSETLAAGASLRPDWDGTAAVWQLE